MASMTKRAPDTVILDALWAWCGRPEPAARSVGMARSSYYERLDTMGITVEARRTLRETGQLNLSGPSGPVVYVPTAGTVRYVQPNKSVRMQSEDLNPNLGGKVSTTTQGAEIPTVERRAWLPKPTRGATNLFDRAILELSEVGKDTTRDALLEALVHSKYFRAFVDDAVGLYRQKAQAEEDGK